MTKTITTEDDNAILEVPDGEVQLDFYFWLGLDGELKSLRDKEELDESIETNRDNIRRWLEVDVEYRDAITP